MLFRRFVFYEAFKTCSLADELGVPYEDPILSYILTCIKAEKTTTVA